MAVIIGQIRLINVDAYAKMIDVVAAIIEQDGKILLAQRPPHATSRECGSSLAAKWRPGESQPQALTRELQEEMGIIARPTCYIASHQREVSGRQIHLHAWWVPHFQGTPLAHYHSQLRWCLPADALTLDLAPADIPLLHAFIAQRPTFSVC